MLCCDESYLLTGSSARDAVVKFPPPFRGQHVVAPLYL